MKTFLKTFYGGILEAWEMLADFPVPEFMKLRPPVVPPAKMILCAAPVLGAVAGLLAAWAAGLTGLLFSRISGAVAFALLSLILIEGKDSGRALALECSFLLNFFRRSDRPQELSSRLDSLGNPAGMLLFMLMVLGKAVLLGALFWYGGRCFTAAVLTAAFTIQAALAAERFSGVESVLLTLDDKEKMLIWKVAGAVAVVLLFFHAFAVLVSAAAVYGLFRWFRFSFSQYGPGSVSSALYCRYGADALTLAGGAAEWCVWIIALLLVF